MHFGHHLHGIEVLALEGLAEVRLEQTNAIGCGVREGRECEKGGWDCINWLQVTSRLHL